MLQPPQPPLGGCSLLSLRACGKSLRRVHNAFMKATYVPPLEVISVSILQQSVWCSERLSGSPETTQQQVMGGLPRSEGGMCGVLLSINSEVHQAKSGACTCMSWRPSCVGRSRSTCVRAQLRQRQTARGSGTVAPWPCVSLLAAKCSGPVWINNSLCKQVAGAGTKEKEAGVPASGGVSGWQ